MRMHSAVFGFLPRNRCHAVLFQQDVGLGEMAAAEKASMGGQGTGMHRGQFVVDGVGNQLCLALGVGAPQEKHHGGGLIVQLADDTVGEALPSLPLMAGGLSLPHGEHRIEQQHTLLCPGGEVAAVGNGLAHVLFQLFEDVFEAGRRLYPLLHRKAQTVSLLRSVVGVLTDDHHLHVQKGGVFEGVEDVVHIGIHRLGGIFPLEKLTQGEIILLAPFVRQNGVPIVADTYHSATS